MKTSLKLLFVLLFLGSINGYSQDKMYLKNSKDVMLVDIIEIGSVSVRYKPFGDTNSVIFNMDKALISKIETEEGDVYTFKDPLTDPAVYADQNKNALKIGFFNPFLGSLQFSYERSLKPGRSIETTLGMIGLGFDPADIDPRGVTAKFGYKLIKTPDYIIPGMKASHILNGGYIKPEIIFNYFAYDGYTYDYSSYYSTSGRYNSFSGAIVLNLGKQWVISNFLIDLYIGAGYGFASNGDDDYSDLTNYYGFVGAFPGFPIALSGGLKMGFLFK